MGNWVTCPSPPRIGIDKFTAASILCTVLLAGGFAPLAVDGHVREADPLEPPFWASAVLALGP